MPAPSDVEKEATAAADSAVYGKEMASAAIRASSALFHRAPWLEKMRMDFYAPLARGLADSRRATDDLKRDRDDNDK